MYSSPNCLSGVWYCLSGVWYCLFAAADVTVSVFGPQWVLEISFHCAGIFYVFFFSLNTCSFSLHCIKYLKESTSGRKDLFWFLVLGGSVHNGEVGMAEFMECYGWGSGSMRLPAYILVDQKINLNWSGRNWGQAIPQKT